MRVSKISTRLHKVRGASLLSYGLLVGLIAVIGLGAITSIGSNTDELFNTTAQTMQNVSGTSQGGSGPSAGSSPGADLAPDAFSFSPLTGQNTGIQVESGIVQITGHDGVDASISGDGSPEFRICSDSGCSSVTSAYGNTTRSVTDGDYVQLRMTSSASQNTAHTATLAAGQTSGDWSVTTFTSGTNLVPGNTTLIASRGGFDVRCLQWNGTICERPQVRPPASGPSGCSAFSGTSNDWYYLAQCSSFQSNGDSHQWFCHFATGNIGFSNASDTGVPIPGIFSFTHRFSENYDCSSDRTAFNSGITGVHPDSDWVQVGFCNSSNISTVRCTNW
ncbi:MAG: hypothetical protein Alpg2KO_30920 [Alphaproteobacteria bacterium]